MTSAGATADSVLRALWLWHVNTKKNDKLNCLRELERTYLLAKRASALHKRNNLQKQLKLLDSPGGIVKAAVSSSKASKIKKAADGKQLVKKRSKKLPTKTDLIFPASPDHGGPAAGRRVLPGDVPSQ